MEIEEMNVWTEEDIAVNQQHEELFIIRKRKELLKAEDRRRKKELKEIKSKDRFFSNRVKKLTTTKILMYFILINCTIIEVYSMDVMYLLNDLSPLYSLIGAVIGESLSYAIYCAKSFNDSRSEEKAKLERDKFTASLSTEEKNSLDGIVPDPIPMDDDHSGDIPCDANLIEESSAHADEIEG